VSEGRQHMKLDDDKAYRVVIITHVPPRRGSPERTYTEVRGPYRTSAPAKAILTAEKNRARDWTGYMVEGKVQVGTLVWEDL
jgi:hypothetical protein